MNQPFTHGMDTRNPDQDVFFMRQALALAEGALYVPSPNPRVGCLIVREGQVLGRGATQVVGSHHAEINDIDTGGQKTPRKSL